MTRLEPAFLSRQLIDLLHEEALRSYGGGRSGIRDNSVIDSAIGRAVLVNDYLVGCDLFDIAGAYAHGIAEGQGYVDGNKRTGISAALIFLESNGVNTSNYDDEELYEAMIGAAGKKCSRDDIAAILRSASED